jgi:CheY-like chemotaxis protein
MVIVVEPSSEVRSAIGSALRGDGHEVIELCDGAQLLARLMSLVALLGRREDSIAVVASPEPSVSPVLQMLRSARWRTPVVFVPGEGLRPAVREVGAIASLGRPLDLEALRAAVAQAVPPGR